MNKDKVYCKDCKYFGTWSDRSTDVWCGNLCVEMYFDNAIGIWKQSDNRYRPDNKKNKCHYYQERKTIDNILNFFRNPCFLKFVYVKENDNE